MADPTLAADLLRAAECVDEIARQCLTNSARRNKEALAARLREYLPRTEGQVRARFETYWCPPDHDEAPGFHVHKEFARLAYLAALRDAGLLKDKAQ